jgi:hypothetical protein
VGIVTVSVTGNQPLRFVKTDMEHLIATIAESLPSAQIRRGPASPYARPLATLALDHPVALLQQPLALAILAFLLLLDVGALLIGHDNLPASVARITIASPAVPSISPHKRFKRSPYLLPWVIVTAIYTRVEGQGRR